MTMFCSSVDRLSGIVNSPPGIYIQENSHCIWTCSAPMLSLHCAGRSRMHSRRTRDR
jgi:hypothetical protein